MERDSQQKSIRVRPLGAAEFDVIVFNKHGKVVHEGMLPAQCLVTRTWLGGEDLDLPLAWRALWAQEYGGHALAMLTHEEVERHVTDRRLRARFCLWLMRALRVT